MWKEMKDVTLELSKEEILRASEICANAACEGDCMAEGCPYLPLDRQVCSLVLSSDLDSIRR